MRNLKTNTQNIYIDTYFVQGYLWGKRDEEENIKPIFSKIKSSIKNPNINVKIPSIVVGELINNLRGISDHGEREDIMYNFFKLLNELEADIIAPNKCSFDIAKSLIEDDYLAKQPSDVLIASCALCDPDSSHMLFHDGLFLESRTLEKMEKDMRDEGKRNRPLRITEEFGYS
jgi:hypothetical protein